MEETWYFDEKTRIYNALYGCKYDPVDHPFVNPNAAFQRWTLADPQFNDPVVYDWRGLGPAVTSRAKIHHAEDVLLFRERHPDKPWHPVKLIVDDGYSFEELVILDTMHGMLMQAAARVKTHDWAIPLPHVEVTGQCEAISQAVVWGNYLDFLTEQVLDLCLSKGEWLNILQDRCGSSAIEFRRLLNLLRPVSNVTLSYSFDDENRYEIIPPINRDNGFAGHMGLHRLVRCLWLAHPGIVQKETPFEGPPEQFAAALRVLEGLLDFSQHIVTDDVHAILQEVADWNKTVFT
jgi:hypothetical protein